MTFDCEVAVLLKDTASEMQDVRDQMRACGHQLQTLAPSESVNESWASSQKGQRSDVGCDLEEERDQGIPGPLGEEQAAAAWVLVGRAYAGGNGRQARQACPYQHCTDRTREGQQRGDRKGLKSCLHFAGVQTRIRGRLLSRRALGCQVGGRQVCSKDRGAVENPENRKEKLSRDPAGSEERRYRAVGLVYDVLRKAIW